MSIEKIEAPTPAKSIRPAPDWITQPTLQSTLIERIRAGGTLEELKEYYRFMREIEADEAKNKYLVALAQAQHQMTTISRDMENPTTRSTYASLAAVDRVIRPIYSELGISVSFDTRPSSKGETWIQVVAEVGLGNYSREHTIDMPADGLGAKGGAAMTRTHATMSAITYARRALLKNIFNLAEADDDGAAASIPGTPISETQADELMTLIARTATDIQQFCSYYKIEGKTVRDLPANQFDDAIAFLKAKEAKQARDKVPDK